MPYRAYVQLRMNIDTLLRARHEDQKSLADAMGKHPTTLNKFLKGRRVELQLADVDKIAAFFGASVYELFQPGGAILTERRHSERRGGHDRRMGTAKRHIAALAAAIEPSRPGRRGRAHVVATSPLVEELNRLAADYARRIGALLSQAELGRQAAGLGETQPAPPRRRRSARGSDPSTPKDE